MKLSVTTWSFETLSLDATLAIAKGLGFENVDIAGFHQRGRCSLEPDEVGANPDGFADDLNALMEKWNLKPVDYFPQFGAGLEERAANHPDPESRRKNRESIKGIARFCALTGIPGITVSPGVNHLNYTLQQNLEVSAREMKAYSEIAGEHGVVIRVEPHMQSCADTPEWTLEILEHAPDCRVTLDYGHFLLQYIDMERSHALIPHTDHVHVRQARGGKLQTRTQEGEIDYADIIDRLARVGFSGCLSIEYVCIPWYDCNQVDCITETVLTKEAIEPHLRAVDHAPGNG